MPAIQQLDPRKLKKHMQSLEIYGEQPSDGMEESVKTDGIIHPIVVAADKRTIVSGVRRRNAAIKARMKTVPCLLRSDLKDDLDIRRAIIQANKHQDKSTEVKAREYKVLMAIEEERARARRNPSKTVPQNSAERHQTGEARKIAADEVGMSHDTAEKAAKVVDAIDKATQAGDRERAQELRDSLERSVNSAHKKVAPPKKPAKKKPREVTPAKVVDELRRQHVSPLVRGIDQVAKINGGKGRYHTQANKALDNLLLALKEMRGGKK